ncbi:hypothetical protein LTR04_001405 [Oleoguttula sp. CCFEE 6159]|nr:hypothetical protein LTR04_001405 [Oleoguttula sp. CCFEE 6159]
MVSLLLTVFILQVVIHLINTVGATTINELLWALYNKLPTPSFTAARNAALQKREVLRLKKEMNGISAQDDFARWAKIRRQHDKAVAEHDKSASALQASKSRFDNAVTSFRWLSTNGLRFFLQYWYARTPLFWLPQGWVPGYVEWILSFPRAPIGSISIQVWGIACASVVKIVGEAVAAGLVLNSKQPVGGAREPQAFGAGQQEKSAAGVKKEL